MTTSAVEARGSDFAKLARRINEAGLLERRPVYYTVRISLTVLGLIAGVAAFVWAGDSWWTMLLAPYLAIAFAQIAFIGHDLGHLQVFRRRKPSALYGRLLGNLGIGLGWEWWTDKHTRHHANPNHEEHDPDVSPSVIVWSQDQLRQSKGLPRFVARYQAYLFFPVLTLEAWHLHIASFKALFKAGSKHRWTELALLTGHVVWYVALLFTVLSPVKAVVFLVVHQALFGLYLGSTFAPNHKGMPTMTGDTKVDYLRKQVLTSRNVRGGVVTDIALGGLNYQIEHHLFPNMPTPNLRHAQPIVREYCAELGVPYEEDSLMGSYGQALRHLHSVGAPLRS